MNWIDKRSHTLGNKLTLLFVILTESETSEVRIGIHNIVLESCKEYRWIKSC